jgi:undecaprenyl-diphosphatase
LDRESAARFSFLLAVPAILGALVLSLLDLLAGATAVSGAVLLAGLISSAVTGYLAIRFFLGLVRRGRLVWFSYYTWLIGVVVIAAHLL